MCYINVNHKYGSLEVQSEMWTVGIGPLLDGMDFSWQVASKCRAERI